MFKYSINLAWSDEDNCYLATIPEFPGLMTHGDTPGEAVAEAEVVAKGFIEIYKEDGDPVPEPIKAREYSGNLRIRIPKSLHHSLTVEAYNEGVSLNSHIMYLLSVQSSISQTAKTVAEEVQRSFSEKAVFWAPYQNATTEPALDDPFSLGASQQLMEGFYNA